MDNYGPGLFVIGFMAVSLLLFIYCVFWEN
jgi:hypothetical protein